MLGNIIEETLETHQALSSRVSIHESPKVFAQTRNLKQKEAYRTQKITSGIGNLTIQENDEALIEIE